MNASVSQFVTDTAAQGLALVEELDALFEQRIRELRQTLWSYARAVSLNECVSGFRKEFGLANDAQDQDRGLITAAMKKHLSEQLGMRIASENSADTVIDNEENFSHFLRTLKCSESKELHWFAENVESNILQMEDIMLKANGFKSQLHKLQDIAVISSQQYEELDRP